MVGASFYEESDPDPVDLNPDPQLGRAQEEKDVGRKTDKEIT